MGSFDIDSGTDNHLLNEQFHVFSKSPASVATALGDASNRSGHTVTASDVWGQEIPAFFYAKTQSVADSYKSLAKTNDLCRIGNSVAIFENGNWVVKYNSYTDIPDGHKFKNAAGDDVIRFHKNRLAYNLNLDNNAADDGLDTTAKIQGWDEENSKVYDYEATAPKFVTQFVTSTDKIVDGIPSKGFGPFVMAGTTTGDITKVLPEGTSDPNHYIANSFAGIIQFNKARTDAIYVHAFEYCGKTLKSAYGDIKQHSDEISTIKASLGLEETPGTSSLGSRVSDNEAALRTLIGLESDAKVVASESITATANNAAKAAVEGVNVTSTGSNGVVASQVKSVVSLEVTPATVAATGVITENADNVVTATGAKAIADKAASDAITAALADTAGSAITEKIESEIAAATLPDGQTIAETTATDKLVTVEDVKTYVENNAKVSINGGNGISVTPTGKATEFTVSVDTAVVATQTDVSTAKSELQGEIDKINTSLTTGTIHTEIDGVRQIANAAKNTADTAVQSVTRATGSSELITVTDGTDVTISLSTEVATKSDITTEIDKLTAEGGSVKTLQTKVGEIETSLATGGTTANAIKAAQDAADAAQKQADKGVTDAAAALAEAQKRISKVTEGTDSSLLTVETTGTEVTITLDGDVATKTHVAGEIKTVTEAATALAGRVTTAEGKIKTLEETVPDVKTIAEQGVTDAKAADDKAVAAANAVTTLGSTVITEQSVTGAGIAVTLKGSVKAPTLTGSVTTASYTKASGETPGTWSNDTNVVTGATVKDALADVASAHSKDIQTLQTAINGLTTTGLTREVLPNGQTTADIKDPKANVIYLVKDTTSETGAYVEYLYVDGTYEAIGTTSTDLSEYAKTGGSTKTIADLATEVATAQGEVDALEIAVSTLSQTHASDKTALENSIKAVSDKVGTDSVATQISTELAKLTDTTTQGGAGVSLTQTNGRVALTVTSGVVAASGTTGADKFVKGETVHAAIEAEKSRSEAAYAVKGTETAAANAATAAATAQTTAEAKVESITTSDARITLTPTTANKVKSVAITLASTVATTTDGTAYSKSETDAAVKVASDAAKVADDKAVAAQGAAAAAQATADAKIGAVEVTTDAASHFGAQHISAVTDDDKKVTISVTHASEWSVGTTKPAGTITSVINGKMSDGKTIDDANLIDGTSMFASKTLLTTYVGDLGKLTTGTNMFSGCTSLKHFCADLGSLSSAAGMFTGCPLSVESFMYIVDSLPGNGSASSLGITVTPLEGEDATLVAELKIELEAKGWKM